MKRFFHSIGFRVLVAVALVLVGVMIYAATTQGVATIPATISGAILSPLQTAVTAVGEALDNVIGVFTEGGTLKRENAALQEELNALRDKLVNYDSMKQQYEELIRYLGLKEQHPDYQFATARVIAQDPTDNYGNFTVNVGTTAGVRTGDPVITAEGLVGVVSETGLNWAKVSTILDSSTHVSASVSRTQDTGTTGGNVRLAQQGLLQMNYLERESGATAGDYVITAGGSSRYPAKLKIGQITEVVPSSDGLSMTATVKPFANISHVTDVLIILDFEE